MPATTPPPKHLRDEVESILIGEQEIAVRVRELAADIERDFAEQPEELANQIAEIFGLQYVE